MADTPSPRIIRAIEDSFPIVEINRLAVPERNAFKPIYQMHKWFARRASCVFRAILLGCLKPLPLDEHGKPTKTGAQVIMEEFYKDHTGDPDTKDRVILDPFMGGGTTVVEALRLGCRVIGIDLNPVAWFIVKTEVEPVDLEALQDAFERLAERPVAWSGKSVRETLLSQYRSECPCCGAGREEADIIYTFWVKSAICTACKKQVPLFRDYLIAHKSPSIRYWRDAGCPRCHKTFDWEIEPAALVAEPSLQLNNPTYSAGAGRSTVRWAYSPEKTVQCPWCQAEVTARPAKKKPERKKVPLAVLLCPFCESVWQWRGEVLPSVACPGCKKDYNPLAGNIPSKGEFLCAACGHRDAIIQSIRRLPEDQLLPIHPYALEGYCARCGGDGAGETEIETEKREEDVDGENDLFGEKIRPQKAKRELDHPCRVTKNGGKFFKRVTPADLRRIEDAVQTWEREKARLPYPKRAIPEGFNTNQMIKHNYRSWHQMFHPRQLLCLATLLEGICEERNQTLKEMLLCAFSNTLEANNVFTRNIPSRSTPGGTPPAGVFARHDFQPKATFCEQNVWGTASGNNTFTRRFAALQQGLRYATQFVDQKWDPIAGTFQRVETGDNVRKEPVPILLAGDSRLKIPTEVSKAAVIVTDPPYAGNVNYSELSDFFYVWLRLILAQEYVDFAPEQTPKAAEIIENPTRGLSANDFEEGIRDVFQSCARCVPDGALVVFTFHHSEGSAWESLLRAVCAAGLQVEAVYPVHAEREASLHLLDKEAISYDLIHVCKKRDPEATREPRSWAGIRQEIRRRAREEIAAIEAGRYGNELLSPADVNIVLIGKCLELYSKHYGAVVDHEGKNVPLHEALKQIRDIADQMTERERPLPSELEDLDPESCVYLRALCAAKEVKSDDVHKATRGILEPAALIAAGLMTKMRAGRGRSYEVKQPAERLTALLEQFRDNGVQSQPDPSTALRTGLFGERGALINQGPTRGKHQMLFIDRVHLLLGLVEAGENILPWLDRFRGETPQIRAALEYVEGRSRSLAPACRKVLGLLEVGPLFKGVA